MISNIFTPLSILGNDFIIHEGLDGGGGGPDSVFHRISGVYSRFGK